MGNCFRRQDSELQLTQHDSIVHQQSNYVTSHNSVGVALCQPPPHRWWRQQNLAMWT